MAQFEIIFGAIVFVGSFALIFFYTLFRSRNESRFERWLEERFPKKTLEYKKNGHVVFWENHSGEGVKRIRFLDAENETEDLYYVYLKTDLGFKFRIEARNILKTFAQPIRGFLGDYSELEFPDDDLRKDWLFLIPKDDLIESSDRLNQFVIKNKDLLLSLDAKELNGDLTRIEIRVNASDLNMLIPKIKNSVSLLNKLVL